MDTATSALLTTAAAKRAALAGLADVLADVLDRVAFPSYRRIGTLPGFDVVADGHRFDVAVDGERAWTVGRDGGRWELGHADARAARAALTIAINRR